MSNDTIPGIRPGPYGQLPFDLAVLLDTETTGLWPFGIKADGTPTDDPEGRDRLCSLGLIRARRVSGNWVPEDFLLIKVDPFRTVPAQASAVNGFHRDQRGETTPAGLEELRGLPTFADLADRFSGFVEGLPIVCHNAAFDVSVVDAELDAAGLPPLAVPVVCTKKSFSEMSGLGRPNHYVPNTNLNALCALLGVANPDRDARHDALKDARLTLDCLTGLDAAGWLVPEDPADLPHRALLARRPRR
jgi:DNA polymerase-3 subunit epsilon